MTFPPRRASPGQPPTGFGEKPFEIYESRCVIQTLLFLRRPVAWWYPELYGDPRLEGFPSHHTPGKPERPQIAHQRQRVFAIQGALPETDHVGSLLSRSRGNVTWIPYAELRSRIQARTKKQFLIQSRRHRGRPPPRRRPKGPTKAKKHLKQNEPGPRSRTRAARNPGTRRGRWLPAPSRGRGCRRIPVGRPG
jgi:hypothetical protein